MKAVITAGGRIEGAFASAAGTSVKALAPVRGLTMLARVLEVLRDAGTTRVALIGGGEVAAAFASQVELMIAESPSGSENMLRALRAWPEDGEPLLYATSDLPFITVAAVQDFVARAPAKTLAVPLAECAAYAARFPGAPPFGIRLAGECVVNGGVFLLPPGSAQPLATIASGFFEARKKPWKMARLIGAAALLRFAFGRLSIAHLEEMAARVLALPARAIRNCAPELAFDVDTAVDYRYACERA